MALRHGSRAREASQNPVGRVLGTPEPRSVSQSMQSRTPEDKNDTTRIEQPGDDGPCGRCADREEDCRECQETNTMTAREWTRAAYGDTEAL